MVEVTRVYEDKDYFYSHVAGWDAEWRTQEVFDQLVKFLESVGAKLGYNAEWAYARQCRGLYAERDGETWTTSDEPMLMNDVFVYCDVDYNRAWNTHYPKMKIYYKCADRAESDEVYWKWYEKFEEERDKALHDVCHAAEALLDAEYEYAFSDEAYDEWMETREDGGNVTFID